MASILFTIALLRAATTFSIMTLSITTLRMNGISITILSNECHYAECPDYLHVMLNVVMLNVIVLNPIMLDVVMPCLYVDFRYAESHYAECRYAECRYTESRGTLLRTICVKKCVRDRLYWKGCVGKYIRLSWRNFQMKFFIVMQ